MTDRPHPGTEGFSLPGSSASGRDVTEGNLQPARWGRHEAAALRAELERRLAEWGEATVRLDPDTPFPVTEAVFAEEVDSLIPTLAVAADRRTADAPFTEVVAVRDPAGGPA